jgi:hypothetical protein
MTPTPNPNPVLRTSSRAGKSPARGTDAGLGAGKLIVLPSAWSLDFRNVNVAFLDTKSTDPTSPELLSLGLVSWRGEEHYVELDPGLPASAPILARASHLPCGSGMLQRWGRVPGSAASYQEMGLRTSRWLQLQAARFGHPLHIAFRAATHYELLQYRLRGVGEWDAVRKIVCPVNADEFANRLTGSLGAAHVYAALHKRGLEQDHALGGAHDLRAACIAMATGKRVDL